MAKQDSNAALAECKANVVGKTTAELPMADADQILRDMGAQKVRVVEYEYSAIAAGSLALPLRYRGGDLGLGNNGEPWIEFQDAAGKQYMTHSVKWLLKNIDLFAPGRDQEQPLACAALHYGLNVFALMGRDIAADEGRTWAAQRRAA